MPHTTTYGPLSIAEMQEAILEAGYVWLEQVFCDGGPDCFIRFTKDKNPHYFTEHPCGDKGWGRFNRHYAWHQAYDCIVLGTRH